MHRLPQCVAAVLVTKRRYEDRVLDLIDRLSVGEAILSERQLSTDLGVSRPTVRAALDELVREISHPQTRRGHLRQRAEDRPGADDDVLHRGCAARPGARQPHAEPGRSCRRAAGRRLHVSLSEPRRSSQHASGWRIARPGGHRDAPCPKSLAAPDGRRSRGRFFLRAPRVGANELVGGMQTIEPTVTNEEESAAPACPHSPAFARARHAIPVGGHRRVRTLGLPRRSLPARHRVDAGGLV